MSDELMLTFDPDAIEQEDNLLYVVDGLHSRRVIATCEDADAAGYLFHAVTRAARADELTATLMTVARTNAERDAALALLLDIEWQGGHREYGFGLCPVCQSHKDTGHAPGCALDRVLTKTNARVFDPRMQRGD